MHARSKMRAELVNPSPWRQQGKVPYDSSGYSGPGGDQGIASC